MNNFDENKEFVRRKIDPNAPQAPTRNLGQVRRPQSSPTQRMPMNGRVPDSGVRRPAAPQTRPASAQTRNAGAQTGKTAPQTRPSSPSTAPKPPKQVKARASVSIGALIRNALIFVAMLVGLLLLGFGLVLSTLYIAPEKDRTAYSFYYGSDDRTPSEPVTVNKVTYMDLTEISEMCGFTVSGTKACLRYTASEGEYVEFTIGSVSARINGDIVNMEGAALVRENESVWIPVSFGEAYFDGLTFEKDEEKSTFKVLRIQLPESSDEDPIYEGVTFRIKGSQALEGIDEDPHIGEAVDLGFVNDLSEYEQYMNPENRDDYLILVNKTNHISDDAIPENLVSIVNVRKDGRKEQMVECAEKALEAMFIELESAGYKDVSVTSGYRSYQKQVSLFSTYLQREMANDPSLSEAQAKEIVLTYSAFPGTSEHQTGLCCDMHNLKAADVAFARQDAYKWLKENCYKFGFVIRFPEDKVDITGYSFEPWHYRFVGRYHATRMNNLGMCLEEYVEHLARAED